MSRGSPETGEIERDLDATRSRLDATIGALQQKLAPGSVVEEAVTYFKESGGVDITRTVGRSMRDNPVPVALIGVGLGWLVLNEARRGGATYEGWKNRPWMDEDRFGGNGDREVYGSGKTRNHQPMPYEAAARDDLAIRAHEAGAALHRYPGETEDAFHDRVHEARGTVLGLTRWAGEAADSFKQRVEEAMRAAADGIGAVVQGAADLAGDLAGRGQAAARSLYGHGASAAANVRDYGAHAASNMRDAGSRTVDYVQDRPLLLGALGVTVGAVIGLMMPASRYERRMAGSLRQSLGDTARETAGDLRERAMHVADSVLDAAHEAARREGLSPPEGGVAAAARDKVTDVAGRARRVVEDTASAGREALEQERAGERDPLAPAGHGRTEQRIGQVGQRRAGA